MHRAVPENVLNEPWPFPSTSGYTLGYACGILRGILLDHGRLAGRWLQVALGDSWLCLLTNINQYQQILVTITKYYQKLNKY